MNVHVNDSCEEFKPITLTVDIASKQELMALWHRLDVGGAWLVKRHCENNPVVAFPGDWDPKEQREVNPTDCTEPLFKAVDELAVSRGLRTGGKVGH